MFEMPHDIGNKMSCFETDHGELGPLYNLIRARGYKTFFMVNSTELKCYPA